MINEGFSLEGEISIFVERVFTSEEKASRNGRSKRGRAGAEQRQAEVFEDSEETEEWERQVIEWGDKLEGCEGEIWRAIERWECG